MAVLKMFAIMAFTRKNPKNTKTHKQIKIR